MAYKYSYPNDSPICNYPRISKVTVGLCLAYKASCRVLYRGVLIGLHQLFCDDLGHLQVGSYRYRSLIEGLYTL